MQPMIENGIEILGMGEVNIRTSKALLGCASEKSDWDDLIKLYLSLNDLVIQCYFTPGLKDDEETERTINLLTSRGITPSMTIKNSTYSGVFHFNLSMQSSQPSWSITIPMEKISTNQDIAPVEEWFITISLQEGLYTYTTEGTLLDLSREPLLQWKLGKVMKNHVIASEINNVKAIKITKCPCANDVALVGLVGNANFSGIHIGLTYSGFWEQNDTVWYDLTSNICTFSDEECITSSVVEIVLTNHHLVILTTVGLYISADLRYPNGTLVFSRVSFCGFNSDDYIQAKLWYNEICLANQEHFEDDYMAITFSRTRSLSQLSTCFYSVTPFDNWETCLPNPRDPNIRRMKSKLLSFLIDNELNDAIYLFYDRNHSFVTVRKYVKRGPKTEQKFPSFFFPGDFHNVTGMAFHPRTHFLYVYGNQVWISYDGGNSFERVANFHDEVIIVSYHSFHSSEIIFVSQTSKLYFSKAGIKSYIELGESKYTVFAIYYDHLGTEALITLSNNDLDSLDIIPLVDNRAISQIKEDDVFDTILAPQYISMTEIIFFAYVPQNATQETRKNLRFYQHHVGRLLRLRSFGKAEITSILYHENYVGFPSSAIATIIRPFEVEVPVKSSSLLGSIIVEIYSEYLYKIVLHKAEVTPQFKNNDIGKTVVIPGRSSLLILEILNTSIALALATMPNSVPLGERIESRRWFLYHFGTMATSGWYITPSLCKHVIVHDDVQTGKHILKYLDLGSDFNFKIKVLSDVPYNIRKLNTPLIKIVVGHASLMDINTNAYFDETDGYVVEMSITNKYFRNGITSISFIVWEATVTCQTSLITLTLKSSCSYTKYMSFLPNYQISFDEWEYGSHEDEHGFNMIKTLPKNYRPPSSMGIAIPITSNFYNADPSSPKPRNYHPKSKETGIYKQCLNKTSRDECNCTTEQKMSQYIAFSDCREKVVRFMYPVIQYPIFLNIKHGDSSVPMEAPYLVTISEVNNRKNWKLKQNVTNEIKKMKEYLEKTLADKVYNPKGLNLSITGSELYHFRVTVIPGVTFCKLITEFQIYVDSAPFPFPGRLLICSITTVILGGIILSVFMVELFDVHIWLSIKNLVLRKNKIATSDSSIDLEDQ
ncbi:cation channel sperm-associated protein subunit beta-like [Dromiciops gliroides]|uniref:cation channel sperm-associated protein subunit beta-like n=1 Tax=Dromiciops gliroides TaxID=33562 RepID=UPI001CC784BA|nr:cation channel sperm-associated protein subunit beta-like [Dromiciops gliroides]